MILARAVIDPMGMPRPRARVMRQPAPGRKLPWVAQIYMPGEATSWKKSYAAAVRKWRPESPLEGPLLARILAAEPRPKKYHRKKDPDGYMIPSDGFRGHPDADNIAKLVLDALQDDEWFKDDAQVRGVSCFGLFAPKGYPGHIILRLETLSYEGAGELVADLTGQPGLARPDDMPRHAAGPTSGKALAFAF